MFLDRGQHFTRRLQVLRGDGGEIQPEDPVGFEEDPETLPVRDRAIGGAPLKPRDRGGEIQVIGERASERLQPAFPERSLGWSPLRYLGPVAYALTDVVERFGCLSECAERELHPRPVMREKALVAEGERIDVDLDELVDRDGIARRLRHLHAVREEVLAVHPMRDRRVAVRAFGLRDLVLVVRKDVVDPAGVQVETLAEVSRAHRRTLDVPPRKAGPPR